MNFFAAIRMPFVPYLKKTNLTTKLQVQANPSLTLFPMAGGRCVSRQFKIDSIQAGMKFSGLQLNDNSFLSIL